MALANYKLAGLRAGENWDAIIPTVDGNNQVITTSIILHNTTNSQATVELKIRNGGSDYPIFRAKMQARQTLFIAENIILLNGDTLLVNGDINGISVVASADKSVKV